MLNFLSNQKLYGLVRVNRQTLATNADLVGEANLERVPAVVDVLDNFGGFDFGVNEPSRYAKITALRVRTEAEIVSASDFKLDSLRAGVNGLALRDEFLSPVRSARCANAWRRNPGLFTVEETGGNATRTDHS